MTLPQFCLRFIESRRLWLGFNPPLPARNARWSFTRVMVFTLGQTLLGAAIGWVLSLRFRGPSNSSSLWLIWLLAAFSAYQGIVGYGLTAVCWNQRAARLRANPALDISLPPTRYRVIRGLLGLAYFGLLAIITPAAVFLTVENLRGEILWRCERARLVAQGERLEFRDLVGAAIPAEENAGAAAIFAPLFDYHLKRAKTGDPEASMLDQESDRAVWGNADALRRLQERLKFPDRREPKADKESPRTPKVDLAAWAEAYQSLPTTPQKDDPSWVAELKLPTSTNDPARVVLAGLSVADRELAGLCAASLRPRSQFPVHYEEAFAVLLPHLTSVRGAQVLLTLRSAAHLNRAETDAAFNDADCALRVSELLREEPLLISQLVRFAQGAIAERTVWQGLAEHRWTDVQLAAFQERLAKVDYLSGVTLAFEGERVCGIRAIDSWIASAKAMEMVGIEPFPARIISRGMLRQNQIALARYHSRQIALIRAAISNAPQSGLVAVTTPAFTNNQCPGWSPYDFIVGMMAPATDRAMVRAARAQTINRLAIVACALERYHLKHGVFPDKLDDLVPAFLPAPALDPMNNKPFHYQRTDDGWFRLYSVGADGKDDGGVLKPDKKQPEKDWPWPVPTRPERFNLF
jgi:hypothetical protein